MGFYGFTQAAELGTAAIGLVVSDIGASEKFYTEILGMKPSGGFELSEAWSKEAGMSNNRPFAVKTFRMKDHESATTLKLAYFDEVGKGEPVSGIDQYAGVHYLTFYVEDLSETKSNIEKAKIPLVGEVERKNYALLIIRDPDGIFIELIERK